MLRKFLLTSVVGIVPMSNSNKETVWQSVNVMIKNMLMDSSSSSSSTLFSNLKNENFHENGKDDNDYFLILILTLLLLIALLIATICLVVVIIRKRPQEGKRFLVSHGSASIPAFSATLLVITCISLVLQIVDAGIRIKHNNNNNNSNNSSSSNNLTQSFAVISFRMIADYWIYAFSLMLTIFSTQKLIEKYASVNKFISTMPITLWHLLVFVLGLITTFGIGTVAMVARLMDHASSFTSNVPYVKSAYFGAASLIFLYCIIVTVVLLFRFRTFWNPDDQECVNMQSGYILVIGTFSLINFIIQSTFAGLHKPSKNYETASYYVDKVVVLIIAVATLLVFGYWNVELGEDPDQEGLHFSHSRATLYQGVDE